MPCASVYTCGNYYHTRTHKTILWRSHEPTARAKEKATETTTEIAAESFGLIDDTFPFMVNATIYVLFCAQVIVDICGYHPVRTVDVLYGSRVLISNNRDKSHAEAEPK